MTNKQHPREEIVAEVRMVRDSSLTTRLARAERILRRIAENRRGDTKVLYQIMARRMISDSEQWWGEFWNDESHIPPWFDPEHNDRNQ